MVELQGDGEFTWCRVCEGGGKVPAERCHAYCDGSHVDCPVEYEKECPYCDGTGLDQGDEAYDESGAA